MGLDDVLETLVVSKRFWTDFFWLTRPPSGGYPALQRSGIQFFFGNGFDVSVGLDESLSYFPLRFTSDEEWNREIAHDDQAHWIPHALRWEELELIGRAVAAADPEMPHPGLPLLFLYRFAPICNGDDADHVVQLLDAAWRRLGLFSHAEIRRLIERADFRDQGFRWHRDEAHDFWWLGRGDDPATATGVYTKRCRGSAPDEFPSEQWALLLKEAQRVVDEAEAGDHDDEEREENSTGDDCDEDNDDDDDDDDDNPQAGDEITLKSPYPLRKCHSMTLYLALCDPVHPLHECAGRYLELSLSNAMRILDLGSAESSGCSSTIVNGESVTMTDHISISVSGELSVGMTLLRQFLWWMRAPASSQTCGSSSPMPDDPGLALAEAPDGSLSRVAQYLGICKPDELPDCSWLVSHTIPDSARETLDSVLGDATIAPAADEWLIVSAPDGGEVVFNFSRLDESSIEGSGLLELRKLTLGSVGVLHRFMLESGMVLLPVAITAKKLDGDISYRWPRHRVVKTAEELYAILMRGPYDWWKQGAKSTSEEGTA